MNYLLIPRTDLQPSQICLGTSHMGTSIADADAYHLLDLFVDRGGTFLDTAHVYADWIADAPRSASEKMLGRWLRARGNRDRMVVATKGGHPFLSSMQISRLSTTEIIQDLDESLAHLQTDYVDLYWLHRDDPARPVAELLETLEAQRKAGKIRAYGCSNWSLARMKQAEEYAKSNGPVGFVANQPMWSLAQPNRAAMGMPGLVAMDEETYAFQQEHGWAAIPYSSQARGFFSKLARLGEKGLAEADRNAYLNESNLTRMQGVEQLASQSNATPAQLALAYLLVQPLPTFPVIGCRTPAQLEDSLGATQLAIEPSRIQALDAN